MLRNLATSRWLGYLAVLLVYVTVCGILGWWQWNRRDEAQTAIARLDANWSAEATPLPDALPQPYGFDADQQWQRVEMTGEYLADDALMLRGRMRDGSVGFQQVVPFKTDDGQVFYIDRGWIPVSAAGAEHPATVPEVPSGHITVLARLRPNEGDIGKDAPAGQIASVDLESLANRHTETVYTGAYGLLESEDGAVPDDLASHDRPLLDEGPHLSYSLQWVMFALVGIGGFVYALRMDTRTMQGVPKAAKRRSEDDDEEDALLDEVEREFNATQ